jgi:mannitol-1-/sugar-/sorbitol-6-/2-deoxyglucose-6-phosphatase
MTQPGFVASIFDMDGLLVDSERLWQRAEVDIFGALGVPLESGACRNTKGMFVNEVTNYWFERFPWNGPDPAAVAVHIVDAVGALVLSEGILQPGARHAIELCRSVGLPLAIASSSEYRLIELVLAHFDLRDDFQLVHSAEDEAFGKPHPGVFLTAAARLGVDPRRCLVWEDAPAGVLAAKAARMACIAVPDSADRDVPAMGIADAVLISLEEADVELLDGLARRQWESAG